MFLAATIGASALDTLRSRFANLIAEKEAQR